MSDAVVRPADAEALAAALLAAGGAPPGHAHTVAAHLVEAERAGVTSHGLQRVPQYLAEIELGELDPGARPSLARHGARLTVDGRRTFGQVAATVAVDALREAAREHGIALALVHETGHAGRIGAYVEVLARDGLVALAACSGPRPGHRVAPFGGREGRLATNPISWAAPSGVGEPLVADFSTSTTAEGQVRLLRALGRPAVAGTLRTADGQATDDPSALYADPPGTIEPLGGELLGYKGTALGLLVEVLATLLVGDRSEDPQRVGNNLALIAIEGDAGLAGRVDGLAAYVRSSPPRAGVPAVVAPGDRERAARAAHGELVVPAATWQALAELAARHGVALPATA